MIKESPISFLLDRPENARRSNSPSIKTPSIYKRAMQISIQDSNHLKKASNKKKMQLYKTSMISQKFQKEKRFKGKS